MSPENTPRGMPGVLPWWLTLSAVCLAFAGAAWTTEQASDRPDPDLQYKRIFKRLDADADGVVTEAEYVQRSRWPDKEKARKIWRASDADGDGKVTEREYCENRRVTDKAKEVFQWLDADKDGKLTEQEVLAAARRIYREMDADTDGQVGMPEFLSARWRWQVVLQWERRGAETPAKRPGPDQRPG